MGENTTVLQQGDQGRAEDRLDADVEAPIAGQITRVVAVQRQTLPIDDEHRNLDLVFALVEYLPDLVILGSELDLCLAEDIALTARNLILVNGRGIRERGESIENRHVIPPSAEPRGRAQRRKYDFARLLPVKAVLEDLSIGIFEVSAEELATRGVGPIHYLGLFWNEGLPIFLGRFPGIDQDNLEIRRAEIGID